MFKIKLIFRNQRIRAYLGTGTFSPESLVLSPHLSPISCWEEDNGLPFTYCCNMPCLHWNATHGMERVSRVWDRIVQIYVDAA